MPHVYDKPEGISMLQAREYMAMSSGKIGKKRINIILCETQAPF